MGKKHTGGRMETADEGTLEMPRNRPHIFNAMLENVLLNLLPAHAGIDVARHGDLPC